MPTRLSEDAEPPPSAADGGEAADGATEGPKTPPEETYPPSKIPVKKKASRTFPRCEQAVNPTGPAEISPAKEEALAGPRAPPAAGESGRAGRQGVNYTISAMSNREEEIGLDREHFRSLKNFWEKGAESLGAGGSPGAGPGEADPRQLRLGRSLSLQPAPGQGVEGKPGTFTRTRTPYKRTITLSSSEEEPSCATPARKGSVSVTASSTSAKSKGGLVTRNDLLGESSGKLLMPEEEKVVQHCSKKSRLPVRAPSIQLESPTKDVSGSALGPGTPLEEELVVAGEHKPTGRAPASRVQILIEPVPTDGESEDEKEERSDLGTQDNMEINGELPEEKMCESSDQPAPGEPSGEREAVQGTDSAVYSGTEGCDCTL